MSEQDQNPDNGVQFDEPEPEAAMEVVDEQPDASTGEQELTQEDTAPVAKSDGDTTSSVEETSEDVAEVVPAQEDSDDELKKMQHSLRVQAYEKRELKRKLKELEESSQAPSPAKADSGPPKVPRMSDPDVEYDEDKYADKLEQYHAKAAAYSLQQERVKQEMAKAEADRQTYIDRFVQGSAALASGDPEYAELVSASASTHISEAVTEVVLNSDSAALIHRELLKNPDELDALNNMSPAMVGLRIGKLEAKLSASSTPAKPPPKKVSKAPPPVETSKGASKLPAAVPAGFSFDY